MKDKIAYLMKSNDLTTTRFAEILEIQPSTISHLLSGRNKPSYDILQKILRTFPKVNPDWLLLDDEEPFRQDGCGDSSNTMDSEVSMPTQGVDPMVFTTLASHAVNNSDRSVKSANLPTNSSGKSPIFVVVFYDDGSCENFSMR